MDALSQVLQNARTRLAFQHSLAAAGWTASGVLVCFVILLVAGTNVMSWAWLWVFAIVAIALSAIAVRRRLPSNYTLAQELDRKCGFPDVLSTAVYASEKRLTSPAAEYVQRLATETARTVDLKTALPNRRASSWIAALAITFVASGLLWARYRQEGRLDFHPSCLTLWMPSISERLTTRNPLISENQLRERQSSGDHALPAEGIEDQRNVQAGNQTSNGEGSSFFKRVSEALRNLLQQKSGQSEASAEADQQASSERNQERNGDGSKAGSAGLNQKSDPASSHDGQSSGSEGAQTATAQEQQDGVSHNSGQKRDSASNSAQSGAGSDNGSKKIENAAELKAIGKIEQLMGKQAAEISGEMSIVRATGPQQLSTTFTGHEAIHGPGDGNEANEPIAPEDREFVRKYMDELHRITDKEVK